MQDGEEAYHGLILFDASSQWLEEFEEFESAPFTSGAHSDRTPIVIKNSFQSLDEGERKVEECLQCRGVEVGAKRQSGEFFKSNTLVWQFGEFLLSTFFSVPFLGT